MNFSYISLSIPIFFLLIGIEFLIGYVKKRKLYRFNDALANINLGIGQQTIGIAMKVVLGFGYLFIYENARIFDLEHTTLNIVLLVLGVDFFYYWFHRASHQINFLWAAHIVHHQSEDYNLSVALRQSWIQGWFSWTFYLPLAFIGFNPGIAFPIIAFNTLYQFWIHTTTIKSLGPLEWIFNTPSHHRVHHGSNPKYIDKNHAGSLIIWDRMFGTFKQEEDEPVYGITKPLASWSPVWANLHYWLELWEAAKKSNGLDKVRVFLKPPGWQPDYLGGFQAPPEVDKSGYSKFENHGLKTHHTYVFFVFAICLGLSSTILLLKENLTDIPLYSTMAYLLVTLAISGGLMENKKWIIPAEYARVFAALPIALLYWEHAQFEYIMQGVGMFTLVNFFWFSRVVKHLRKQGNVQLV